MKIHSLKDPRSEFLLGISLSEIAFIFFILLLLITVYWIDDKNKEIKKKNASLESIQNKNNEINIILEKNKKYVKKIQEEMGISKQEILDFQTKLVNISRLENEISILKEETQDISKIKDEFTEFELNYENLKNILNKYQEYQNLIDVNDVNIDEMKTAYENFADIEQKIIDIDDITDEKIDDIDDIKNVIENKNEKIEELKFEKLKTLTQLNYFKQKIGTGQWDDPPCFISKENKSQYIYNVEIYDKSYVISGAWTVERDSYVKNIPGAYIKDKTYMTINEFKNLGAKLKQNAKKNQCHHYVKVYDKTKNDKKVWKKNLSILENYFYKKLMY